VEAEPSALFKAQERMNDLVYKNTKRVIGAGDVLLKDACTEGFKAHSTCTQYFQCVRSKWTTQTCPNNLHWDAANNICNWPDAAGCQEGAAPAVEAVEAEDPFIGDDSQELELQPVIVEDPDWESPPTPASTGGPSLGEGPSPPEPDPPPAMVGQAQQTPQYKTLRRIQKNYIVNCNESLGNIIPGSGVKPVSQIRRVEAEIKRLKDWNVHHAVQQAVELQSVDVVSPSGGGSKTMR